MASTFTPWKNSSQIIESIKRKIAMPIAQNLFSEDDLLAFVNEELLISQVPSILKFKEEYFVYPATIPLVANTSRYEIPSRAIGMKLRDIFYMDAQGNLSEMTRISSDDRAYFQQNVGANTSIQKCYLEGNFVVLAPQVTDNPTGSLYMLYYLRPNQLVSIDNAATCTGFSKTITVDNSTLLSGDTVSINNFILTAGSEFAIGVDSSATAVNLSSAINNAYVSSPSGAIVTVSYSDVTLEFSTSNTSAFTVQDGQGIVFDAIPDEFANGDLLDFLQTISGHRTKGMDIQIPTNGISGTTINFDSDDVPQDFIVGDYVCLANECIIPQIPTDLHSGLAERTCVRILASLGDSAGMQMSAAKVEEISAAEGPMIDSRIEGAPKKILNRHSLLRVTKMGPYRGR